MGTVGIKPTVIAFEKPKFGVGREEQRIWTTRDVYNNVNKIGAEEDPEQFLECQILRQPISYGRRAIWNKGK